MPQWTPQDETQFQKWYASVAAQQGLDPNPDNPLHFYDYRAAFKAGAAPDKDRHWPSTFKREGHPQLVVDGMDTRTGLPSRGRGFGLGPNTGMSNQTGRGGGAGSAAAALQRLLKG